MFSILMKILRIPYRILYTFSQIPEMMRMINSSSSYYPEEKLKSRAGIIAENLWWLFKYVEINRYYFSYGFDRVNVPDRENYMPWTVYKHIVERIHRQMSMDDDHPRYTLLMHDKFVFGQLITAMGFKTPKIHAFCDNGQMIWTASPQITSLESLCSQSDLDVYFKPLLGERAQRVFPARMIDGQLHVEGKPATPEDLRKKINGKFIVQERIKQHPDIDKIYPHSANTIRLITIRKGDQVIPFSASLSAGAYGILVDNVDIGGMAGRLDLKTSKVDPVWFRKPKYGGKTRVHPDTGFVFEGFEVPYFQEAIRQAVRLHECLYWFHSIGWDMAITPDGPIFVEGNEFWGIMAQQMLWGGLKRQYLETVPKY
jgi:hypothetical protein